MRLDAPNLYHARISTNGRFVTGGNEFCDVAELESVDGQVQVKPGSYRRLAANGQAYGGYFFNPKRPDILLWWHDEPGQRYRHVYDAAADKELSVKPANGATFFGRDGWFVEQDANQVWLSGGPVANSAGWGPVTLAEGWMLHPTDQTNQWLEMVSPDWRTHYYVPGKPWSNLHVPGPGVATYGVGGMFTGWQPPRTADVPVQVYPVSPRFPWGEVPDYCWTRPNGEVWLASHALDPNAGDPAKGQSWVILRPFHASHAYREIAVPPLDYLWLADLGDRIRIVGSALADAWAVDVVV